MLSHFFAYLGYSKLQVHAYTHYIIYAHINRLFVETTACTAIGDELQIEDEG